jgi:sirohydrochlorin cobaltochelatase
VRSTLGEVTQEDLESLQARLRIVLPPEYQAHYEDVKPVSMGSAGLKFDAAGRVAWDEIWGSFCDLAMAGGPPHKGRLLEPGTAAEIAAEPKQYARVVDEIMRGIRMVTELAVDRGDRAGWVRVMCGTTVRAGWLARAIAMENVSVHLEGDEFLLPAGPAYRVEKEIKNVITATAKTCHYFDGHIDKKQRQAIDALFLNSGSFLQPGPTNEVHGLKTAERITTSTGLLTGGATYDGWLGVECASVDAAVWMMRALVVSNIMARREETTLYLPLNAPLDPDGQRLSREVSTVQQLARLKGF